MSPSTRAAVGVTPLPQRTRRRMPGPFVASWQVEPNAGALRTCNALDALDAGHG